MLIFSIITLLFSTEFSVYALNKIQSIYKMFYLYRVGVIN